MFALTNADAEAVMEHLQPFSYDSQDASRVVPPTPTEGAVEGGNERDTDPQRALHISARPLWAEGPQALVPALTEALCNWVVAEGLEADHKLQAMELLIMLLSTQLYQPPGAGGFNPFLEALMREAADDCERVALEHQGDTSKALGYR
jgi:hypothetical protein